MTTERILTEYTSDTRGFRRGAREYERILARQEGVVNDRLGRIDRRWERSSRSILNMRTAISALTATVSGAALVRLRSYAEGWRDVERRLASIGETSDAAQKGLVSLALRTRSSIGGTVAAVQRLSKSTGDGLDVTTRRVETLQKLLASAGASGAERASVSLQLGQALQSGVLSGDEFRSIRETAPVEFLDALATAAGVTRQELKGVAEDQELTTDIVLDALDNLASTADEKFGSLAVSGEEAFNVLTTGLTAYVGNIDEALGATNAVNGALVFLGQALAGSGAGAELFAQVLAAAGAAALAAAGSRGVGALTRALVASSQVRRAAVTVASQEASQSRATLAQYRLEKVAADQRLRTARSDIRVRAEQGRVTKTARLELARAENAQTRAATALTGAQQRALTTTRALTIAQRQLSAATRIGAASMASFRNVVAFFGGPVGLAITGIGAAMAVISARTASAERATQRLNDQALELAAAYDEAGGSVDRMRASIASLSVAEAAAEARELQEQLARAQERLRERFDQPFLSNLERTRPEIFRLVRLLAEGEISADSFRASMNALAAGGSESLQNLVRIAEEITTDLLSASDASQTAQDVMALLTGTGEEVAAAIARMRGEAESFGQVDMSSGLSQAADEAGRLAENLAAARAASLQETFERVTGGNPDFADPRNEAGLRGVIVDNRPVPRENRPGYTAPSTRGGSKGGVRAAAQDERDLAAARQLLVHNGQRALFIEQTLNAERERLRKLIPDLISLGLSQADAESVVNSELARTEQELRKVGEAGRDTFERLSDDMFSIVRSADSVGDALSRIKDRLLDLATSNAFDKLREGLRGLVPSNSGNGGSGLGNFIGSLLGVEAATGGLIRGPGTGTSDSIPARLSDGEFVVRARSVTPETLPLLRQINRGVAIPRFADGGLVRGSSATVGSAVLSMNVEIHNHASSARVEAQPSQDGRSLKLFLWDAMGEGIANGRLDRPLAQSFGLRRRPGGA